MKGNFSHPVIHNVILLKLYSLWKRKKSIYSGENSYWNTHKNYFKELVESQSLVSDLKNENNLLENYPGKSQTQKKKKNHMLNIEKQITNKMPHRIS